MTDKPMFYGAPPSVFEKAKLLRKNMTSEELRLLDVLNKNQILGLRFKPQHPIHIYIVDFYCHKLKLVIEVDGENHDKIHQREYDEARTRILNGFGIDVIRFSNKEVNEGLSNVIKSLTAECKLRLDRL